MILSNFQLDLLLTDCLERVSVKDTLLFDLFTNCYNTGLRINELLELNRWSLLENDIYLCNTEKGSNNRQFTSNELTELFKNSIIHGFNCYEYNSYSTVNRYFSRYLAVTGIYHETKKMQLNLFRHNKAKLMHDLGFSDLEIKNYYGEVNIDNMRNYIYSELILID